MSMEDEVLVFDFEGVEPAVFGTFVSMPKGEYNLQCVSCEKFYAKAKTGATKGEPDPNKPGLKFTFSINAHPTFTGVEISIWHMLAKENQKFLLNTLMCLIPEFDWQQNGIKIPISQLMQRVQGRPCNGTIDWEINVSNGKKYVNNKLQGLKPFDQGVTQPMPSEGNPPTVVNDAASPVTNQASSGVSPDEVNSFLNDWPGGTATPAASPGDTFGLEPF